jgi:hypothetical protein
MLVFKNKTAAIRILSSTIGQRTNREQILEIYASAEIYTIIRVVFVANHLGVDTGNIKVSGCIKAASGNDYLSIFGLICQAFNDRFLIEEI